MSKQRREHSQDSIFVDNPFVDGFLEWMGSREGRQCIEVRDVLWDLLEDAELGELGVIEPSLECEVKRRQTCKTGAPGRIEHLSLWRIGA